MQPLTDKVTRKYEQAVAALLTCDTIVAAAAQCGVVDSTLHRWMKDDTFKHMYRGARATVLDHAIAQAQQVCGEVVVNLRQVMSEHDLPAAARVSAASRLWDIAIQGRLAEDFDARLAAIEARQAELRETWQ